MRTKWIVQQLETKHHGYDWPTYAIRQMPENYCLAVVGDVDRSTAERNKSNANLIAATPDLLEACEIANKLIKTARRYFPKSIKNSDAFELEIACATISRAITKAKGAA
jgi:hypothetical protein